MYYIMETKKELKKQDEIDKKSDILRYWIEHNAPPYVRFFSNGHMLNFHYLFDFENYEHSHGSKSLLIIDIDKKDFINFRNVKNLYLHLFGCYDKQLHLINSMYEFGVPFKYIQPIYKNFVRVVKNDLEFLMQYNELPEQIKLLNDISNELIELGTKTNKFKPITKNENSPL